MINKIYRKDHLENIRIFGDIDQKKKYSLYSIELDRAFGDKSYGKFFQNLRENKKSKINSFKELFEKEKNEANNLKRFKERTFNPTEFKQALETMKKKTEQKEYRIKNPYKTRIAKNALLSIKSTKFNTLNAGDLQNRKRRIFNRFKKSNPKKKESKIYLPDVPDLGRYNPSYDVLRKHTYQVCFTTKIFTEYNKENNKMEDRLIWNRNTISNMSNIKNIKLNKNNEICSKLKKILKKNYSFNKSKISKKNKSFDDLTENKGLLNMSYSPFKNNHCLKFENYSDRKPITNQIHYKTDKFFSSYKPNKMPTSNICIKFNKISTAYDKQTSYFEKLAHQNMSPPLGLYQPNYDAVFGTHTTNVFLNRKEPTLSKKTKLKKILCSFETPEKYQLFASLNKNKNKKFK